MQSGMTARIAAADVDPYALQQPPIARRRLPPRTLIFILVAAIAYLVGLIALIPARVVLGESDGMRVGGTIWNGQAVIASTVRIDWQFAPVRSLMALGASADFHLAGGGSDLAGSVTKSGTSYRFVKVTGQVDDTLVSALAPNLPFACRFLADVDIAQLVLGGTRQSAEGTMRFSPSQCFAKGLASAPAELPAGLFTITPNVSSSSGALVAQGSQEHLFELRLARTGALSLWPTAMAVQRLPFLAGFRYDTRIE
ncbi:MAG: hypothetical protein ABIP24_00325 [Croceibacterium sp.]